MSFPGMRNTQFRSRLGWAVRQERWRAVARMMKELIRKAGHLPEEGVAGQVVHGGATGPELGELLDALLDHGPVVVGSAGRKGMEPREVRKHMGALGDPDALEELAPPGRRRIAMRSPVSQVVPLT